MRVCREMPEHRVYINSHLCEEIPRSATASPRLPHAGGCPVQGSDLAGCCFPGLIQSLPLFQGSNKKWLCPFPVKRTRHEQNPPCLYPPLSQSNEQPIEPTDLHHVSAGILVTDMLRLGKLILDKPNNLFNYLLLKILYFCRHSRVLWHKIPA